MRRVVVAIDASENALRALKHAIDLAQKNGAMELIIVHAHEMPVLYGEIAVYVTEEKMKELQRQHSEDILRPAVELARAAGVKFTTEILTGNIPAIIVKRAEELGCDGIIMGTRGMGAIGNLVMGSVATKVVHLTKLPVTLVK